jgi:hypothetical protein
MAAFILAFAIASSIVTIQHGFRLIDAARSTTLASQLLQSQMEDLRMEPSSVIAGWKKRCADEGGAVDLEISNLLPSTTAIQDRLKFIESRNYSLTLLVEDQVGFENEIYNLQLQLSWRGLDGRTYWRSIRTHYTKDGLYDYYSTIAGRAQS